MELESSFKEFDKIYPQTLITIAALGKSALYDELTEQELHKVNEILEKGCWMQCPICGNKFIKKSSCQIFDTKECKVKYWNHRRKNG